MQTRVLFGVIMGIFEKHLSPQDFCKDKYIRGLQKRSAETMYHPEIRLAKLFLKASKFDPDFYYEGKSPVEVFCEEATRKKNKGDSFGELINIDRALDFLSVNHDSRSPGKTIEVLTNRRTELHRAVGVDLAQHPEVLVEKALAV